MQRRSFLMSIAALAGAEILSACGSGGSSEPAASGALCGNGGTTTYANPSHAHTTVNLTLAEITTGAAGSYTLLDGSHQHQFTLSTADFQTLRAGGTLTGVAESDVLGHGHLINIVCS